MVKQPKFLMLHLIARKPYPQKAKQEGFTLIEILVAIIIIGIMAAITGPGMLGFFARSKVSSAQSELQGILQEAQRSSIRSSVNCSLTFPATDSKSADGTNGVLTISASPASCMPAGSVSLEEVQVRHNATSVHASYNGTTQLTAELFDFKGSTDDFISSELVFVISNEDNESFQKCIVVSDGLGLIRMGNYPNSETTVDVSKCSASN